MVLDRKINLGLGLQIALEAIRMLERMELETMAVMLIGVLITPFILGSLWSLGIAVMWQLISLGFKAGLMLFLVCSLYMTCLKFKSAFNLKKGIRGEIFEGFGNPPREEIRPKCTLMDLVLSVFFQTGLRLPSFVWDHLMDLYLWSGKNAEDNKMRKERKLPQLMDTDGHSFARAVGHGLMSSPLGNYLPRKMFTPNNDDLPFPLSGSLLPFNSQPSEDDADTDTGSIGNENVFVFETHTDDSNSNTDVVSPTKSTRRRRNGLRAAQRKSVRIAPKHQL